MLANPKRISALAISNMLTAQIADSSVGKVHSKFNNGLNIQFDDTLLYIGTGAVSAFGLNLSGDDLNNLLIAVESGEIVINKGKCLRFYTIGGIWELLYDEAICVDLKIPSVQCITDKIATSGVYNYLANLHLESKIGLEMNPTVKKHLDLLVKSDKNNKQLNIGIIKFFAGRGLGLTPSGDDILLGFTLALSVFGEFVEWHKCMRLINDRQLTTAISIEYTKALLKGYISSNCLELVLSLDINDKDKIAHIVSAVAEFGHTSGYDTLYGFLIGLRFLSERGTKQLDT